MKMADQAPVLADIIDKHNIHIFAEIGVWKFKMVKKLMIDPSVIRTIKEYWAIDPYREISEYANQYHDKSMYEMSKITQHQWDSLYYRVCKYLLWFHQVKLLRLSSRKAAALFSRYRKIYFDMVFIDAIHMYDAVKEDISLWLPLIRKGGILSGHDYGLLYPEVKQAVDELLPDAIIFPESCVWMVYV